MRPFFLGTIALILFLSPAPAQQAPEAATGYTGAYGQPGPATPYWTGPLPEVDMGTGRAVPGPNDTTKTVKAVPCSTAARETDGTTTCIGIPDSKRSR